MQENCTYFAVMDIVEIGAMVLQKKIRKKNHIEK